MIGVISEITGITPSIFWLTTGILLLAVEIIHPLGFFIPFSIAAILIAFKDFAFPDRFQWGAFFDEALLCVIGVGLIIPCRAVVRKYLDKTPNINDL